MVELLHDKIRRAGDYARCRWSLPPFYEAWTLFWRPVLRSTLSFMISNIKAMKQLVIILNSRRRLGRRHIVYRSILAVFGSLSRFSRGSVLINYRLITAYADRDGTEWQKMLVAP